MNCRKLKEKIQEGYSQRELSQYFNCGRSTVRHYMKKFGLKTNHNFSKKYKKKQKVITKGIKTFTKEMQAESARKHYLNNKDKIKNRARANTNKRTKENRKIVKEYLLNNPCVDCGESDIIVLDFDHVFGKKRSNISSIVIKGYSEKYLREEIKKCKIRCSNCHRRKTYRERGLTKYGVLK